MARDLTQEIARLRNQVKDMQKGQRYAHGGSIENNALEVRDSAGSLRAVLGVQGDGTTAVNIVNGPPPPTPSAPILGSVLGGITVSWNGAFSDGAAMPLDWQRVEVHAFTETGFPPALETLKTTFETPQGGTVVVACDEPVYVLLVARNTSGNASTPTVQAGPIGPAPVVATDILDGIVTTVKLADAAVTAAKVKVGAIGADQLALGIGNLAPDPSFEGAHTEQMIAGLADWTIVTPGNNSPKALHVDCTSGAVTWKNVEVARFPVLSGERHFLALDYQVSAGFDGTGVKLMFRYEDATATVTGWGVADDPPVPGAGWARATAQVQAPAGTVTAVLMVEASEVTAGEAWFDNIEVRTLIAGGMIAAGAVAANEIAAGSIETAHLVAEAVQAGNIAAGAVTTAKLDALAVTADKIEANAITVGKIDAGAVDATAIAADAITGKTITGGEINGSTITGALLQTATSGDRITLNEADANKILVYNEDDVAINELSSRGLLVKGTSGAVMWLNPNLTYPTLSLYNAAGTNSANVALTEPVTGDANLEMISGPFAADGYTQMVWRSVLSRDVAVIERLATDATPTSRRIGGRLFMNGTLANLAFVNEDTPAETASFIMEANLATAGGARLAVSAPASTFSALYVEANTAHTGPLLRLYRDSDKFTVDKDGNAAIAGRIKPATGESGTLSLQSGWTNYDTTNYGTATVRKTADGCAYLIGRLQAGTATTGTLVATLPNSSYWPVVRHPFPHRAPQGGVDVTILVNETGELRIYDISGTVTNLSLAGISWPLW